MHLLDLLIMTPVLFKLLKQEQSLHSFFMGSIDFSHSKKLKKHASSMLSLLLYREPFRSLTYYLADYELPPTAYQQFCYSCIRFLNIVCRIVQGDFIGSLLKNLHLTLPSHFDFCIKRRQ